jgi:hypothetical protein
MTMFATTIYLDRAIPLRRLATAFAAATGDSVDRVATITRSDFERSPRRWFSDAQTIGLQTWEEGGDFPLAVEFLSREDLAFPDVLVGVTRALGATALTDVFGVDPLSDSMWTMVAPDGSATTVYMDTGDEDEVDQPDLVLSPESRKVYEAHQPRSGSLAPIA